MLKIVFIGILALANILPGSLSLTDLDDKGPTVVLPQGKLLGKTGTSRNGRSFVEFIGIPYGKTPKRFDLAEPADSWGNDTRDATKFGPWCLQYNILTHKMMGQEDCLVLNIYTPNISQSGNSFPVLVFIHGGGFVQGSANEFGGSYLMNEDVVYVAINYRLGSLGFLNAGVKGASGNAGLKDQILALKWIQQNIKIFGGNPEKVMIFGESAGAGSVSLMTLSPMSKGLFTSAISQSGTALCPFVNRKEDTLLEARNLAHILDCPGSDPAFMVECLRRIQAGDIVKASIPKHPQHYYFDVYTVPQFFPSVETYKGDSSSVFLPDEPLVLLQEGRFNHVPWIVGVNAQEGIVVQAGPVIVNSTLLTLINEAWGRVAPSTFLYHSDAKDPCKLSSKIKKFYFGDEDTKISEQNKQTLVNLYSDRFFTQCTKQSAELYSKYAPVYLYHFTHGVEHSAAALMDWADNSTLKEPTHADDLQFFFDFPIIPYSPGIPKGHSQERFSDNMIKLWASFARDGKPSAVWGSVGTWPMLNTSEVPTKWMEIGQDNLILKSEDPEITRRINFWDDLLN